MFRYRLERNRDYGDKWEPLTVSGSPFYPRERGFVGQRGERLRWRCLEAKTKQWGTVELWEWVERVPVNPGDLQCSDFVAGWKLIERKDPPTPSADELSHFFTQH